MSFSEHLRGNERWGLAIDNQGYIYKLVKTLFMLYIKYGEGKKVDLGLTGYPLVPTAVTLE